MIIKNKIMATVDFTEFHELAEQFKGEVPLTKLCQQEGIPYRKYIAWRKKMGLSPRRKPQAEVPQGLIEVQAAGTAAEQAPSPKATSVRISFENGLAYEREGIGVDSLIEFLTKIRGALCLG